jgi:ribonucleoside-triphosphate reductase (thioredoxin)
VAEYAGRRPPFGFNGLGELVYRRTYARTKADGSSERWHETVERVVNGTYRLQQRWAVAAARPWDPVAADVAARHMYERMFVMKFLPPGRGTFSHAHVSVCICLCLCMCVHAHVCMCVSGEAAVW